MLPSITIDSAAKEMNKYDFMRGDVNILKLLENGTTNDLYEFLAFET